MRLKFKIPLGTATKQKPKSSTKETTPKKKAQDAWVKAQKEAGRVQLSTWVPKKYKLSLFAFASLLRAKKQPEEAFTKSFPHAAARMKNKNL